MISHWQRVASKKDNSNHTRERLITFWYTERCRTAFRGPGRWLRRGKCCNTWKGNVWRVPCVQQRPALAPCLPAAPVTQSWIFSPVCLSLLSFSSIRKATAFNTQWVCRDRNTLAIFQMALLRDQYLTHPPIAHRPINDWIFNVHQVKGKEALLLKSPKAYYWCKLQCWALN